MFILTATFQAKKGKETELEKALLEMIPETAKEKEALEYRLHKSTTILGSYFFYEKYSSKQAFDSHLKTPHYKNLVKVIGNILDKNPLVEMYEFIDGIPEQK